MSRNLHQYYEDNWDKDFPRGPCVIFRVERDNRGIMSFQKYDHPALSEDLNIGEAGKAFESIGDRKFRNWKEFAECCLDHFNSLKISPYHQKWAFGFLTNQVVRIFGLDVPAGKQDDLDLVEKLSAKEFLTVVTSYNDYPVFFIRENEELSNFLRFLSSMP
jgi:hypothetical protein